MVASVAVETRQRAKRNKASADEQEEEKTPPPPAAAAAVRRPRQPTPDHPPYCWMIGEAIDALGEDGGSAEDAISSFIRAAHPGVPAAHDRFLRHYLAKHVAEGFFVCTAPGRYARSLDEAAAVEAPVEPAVASPSQAARVEPPVVQVKRGRGRPRKDGSSSTSPAVKKGGSAGSAAPKRRGRPRKLAKTTDVSGEALVTDKEEDGIHAASTTGKEHGRSLELALVVIGDGSATIPTVDNNVCGEAPPFMPVDSDQPRELALVTATDVPAPMPPMDKQDGGEAASFSLALVAKQDGICATSTAPEPSGQACELALVAAGDGPVPVLVADKIDGDETPSSKYKRLRPPRQALPMVIAAQGSAPTSAAGKKARGKALSATPNAKGHRRHGKLALVATGAHSAPKSVTGKKAGNTGSIATLKLTPVTAGDGNGAPSVAHGQPSRLYPVTADEMPDDPSWCLLALPAVASA